MSAVAEVAQAVGPHVPRLMAAVEERLAALAGGHGPVLAGPAGDTIAAGGKRLRPLLVFLAAGEQPRVPDGLVRAAVAVELIHSATLVHDDVLDAAGLRRGRPTVWAVAGRRAATATGDLLFSRAFAEVAAAGRTDQVRLLSEASSALARGELLQRSDAWNAAVPVERYLRRCELKTARLFAAACELGALEGPAEPAALDAYGHGIGLAFQLLDDVLDVTGPPERTGKSRGTDLLDGTVTLPLILARQRDPALAGLDLRAEVRDAAAAEAVCEAIEATGAVDAARDRALAMVAEVKAALPATLAPRQRAALELVADGVVGRYARDAAAVEIVALGPGDDEPVRAAEHLFDGPARGEATRRFLADPGHHLLVAYAGGEPVGFVSGVEVTHPDKGTEMFLYELSVAPAQRRRGIGGALVRALGARARARGCYGMFVLTARDNDAALATYGADATRREDGWVMFTWEPPARR